MATYLLSFATKLFQNKPYVYIFTNTNHSVLFHSNLSKGSISKNLGYPHLQGWVVTPAEEEAIFRLVRCGC